MKWKVPERMRRILLDLADEGASTGYGVAARAKMSQSSAYDGLKALREKGLVEARVDSTWGNILTKRNYGLTVLGFSHALRLTPREGWQPIIDKWSGLVPLVLGKWSLFVEAGVEDLAMKKLSMAAAYQVSEEGGDPCWGLLSPSQDPGDVFTYGFYDPELGFRDRVDRVRWAAACARDPEVRAYHTKRLRGAVERYTSSTLEAEIQMKILEADDPSAAAEGGLTEADRRAHEVMMKMTPLSGKTSGEEAGRHE